MKKFGGTGGFTLIEIVIVLAIIAVLAGILAPTLTRYVGDARTRKAEADTRNLGAAIGKFYADTGNWPVWFSSANMNTNALKYDLLVSADGARADQATGITGWDETITGAAKDTFTDQLIDNVPAYSTSGRRAWKGPYLESDQADPWGSQYYANVIYLQSIYINATYPSIVLSAGSNKLIETQYSQTGPGITIGGDDIVFRLK